MVNLSLYANISICYKIGIDYYDVSVSRWPIFRKDRAKRFRGTNISCLCLLLRTKTISFSKGSIVPNSTHKSLLVVGNVQFLHYPYDEIFLYPVSLTNEINNNNNYFFDSSSSSFISAI